MSNSHKLRWRRVGNGSSTVVHYGVFDLELQSFEDGEWKTVPVVLVDTVVNRAPEQIKAAFRMVDYD